MIVCSCLLSFLAVSLLLHPVHETVCELEWNPRSHCVEVAIRLDVLDEQWLQRDPPGESKEDSAQGPWQRRYLQSHLLFDPRDGKETQRQPQGLPIRWVGRKVERGHVWWFFEVACPDKQPPKRVRTNILFERDNNYRHLITIRRSDEKGPAKRGSIILTMRKRESELPFRILPDSKGDQKAIQTDENESGR